MGRSRSKYSAKNKMDAVTTASLQHFPKIDFDQSYVKGVDSSNALILPEKRESKKKMAAIQSIPKKLSKKQRKKLERVLDQKRKKEKRAELLASLSTVQVESNELALFDSIAHLGTKNAKLKKLSKRPIPEELRQAIDEQQSTQIDLKGWHGKRKRRKIDKKERPPLPEKEEASDPSSSSDEDSPEEEEKGLSEDDDSVDHEDEVIKAEDGKEVTNDENANVESMKASQQVDEKDVGVLKQSETKDILEHQEITSKPVIYVHVDRKPEIQESRLALPILSEEQSIMEAIKEHSTVIVCGETGSGKTTQVPQFLYEAGFAKKGMIGITEPRRVAAVSMSKRVAMEMNLSTNFVSYHIRYENNVTENTCIKFMTDGILAREIKEDFLLTKYSAIILDEAHERTSNTDVLIGLLSRVVPLRYKRGNPLKLIIMSATLRVEDFTKNERLFKIPPPVIKIDVRQYPVSVHFNKKTPISQDDNDHAYLDEAYRKICKIHRTLPPGGILIFVTGRQEVHALKRKLQMTFPNGKDDSKRWKTKDTTDSTIVNLDDYGTKPMKEDVEKEKEFIEIDASEDEDGFDDDDVMMDDKAYSTEVDSSLPLHVLPLYSLLASAKQKQVFAPVPEGCRLCVVATNVAETSLTIPGIKYVVDTGKVKKRLYDKITGISSFRVTWISKASANQRAGRAGRTEPGHTYRLFSSAVFQDFDEFDLPEIATKPVVGLVLQMKAMKIDRVINFPFPTPPTLEALESAEKLLVSLGAVRTPAHRGSLKEMKRAQYSGTITDLGQLISSFPVHPRFGKMIAMATCHVDVLPYVITIVAALTVREIFFTPSHDANAAFDKEQARQLHARLKHLKSLWSSVGGGPERRLLGDLMVFLGAIGSAEYSGGTPSFCLNNCLRPKAILEIRKLRKQLTNAVKVALPQCDVVLDPKMAPPSDQQIKMLRQLVLSSLGDHVARKIPADQIPSEKKKLMSGAYQSLLLNEAVFIHPDSVLSRNPLHNYVIFQEMVENEKKTFIRDVTAIESDWLGTHCSNYCTYSKPLDTPEPRYDSNSDEVKCHVTTTYGRLSWQLGNIEINYPAGTDRYRWFARFLLEGHVITSLKAFASSLLSRPATMVKSWSNLQPRTESILHALLSRQVESKEKLLQAWKDDNTFLRSAYVEWLPSALHNKLIESWPPS